MPTRVLSLCDNAGEYTNTSHAQARTKSGEAAEYAENAATQVIMQKRPLSAQHTTRTQLKCLLRRSGHASTQVETQELLSAQGMHLLMPDGRQSAEPDWEDVRGNEDRKGE